MTIRQLISDRYHRCLAREGGYPVFQTTFCDFINFDGFVKSRILAADDRFHASFGKLKPTLIVVFPWLLTWQLNRPSDGDHLVIPAKSLPQRRGGNPAIARLYWIPAFRSAAAGRRSRCLWRGMTSLVAGLINRSTVFYTTAPNLNLQLCHSR